MESVVEKFQEIIHIWNPEPTSLYVIKLFTALIASLLTMNLNSWQPPSNINYYNTYDYIIVGGGTSGIVLATELSKNSKHTILVIEAGGDAPLTADIPFLSSSIQRTRYDWNYRTVPQNHSCKGFSLGLCRFSMGKMLGGTDMMQSMAFYIGNKRDWNRWENLENQEWNWDYVLPYFKQFYLSEPLKTFDEFMDSCGDQLENLRDTIYSAANNLDFQTIVGKYESITGKIGYSTSYATIKDGRNNHPGWTFLNKSKQRSNIHFLRNSFVTRIKIESETKMAIGIEYSYRWDDYDLRFISARKEVILCAGAINNPKLLMLSGVGPKDHLEEKDINVVVDLEGVGKNFQDHVDLPGIYHLIKKPSWDNQLDEVKALDAFLLRKQGPFTTIGISSIVGHMYTGAGDRSDYPNVRMNHFYIYKNQIKSKFLFQYDLGKEVKSTLRNLNKEASILVQIPTLIKPKSRGQILLADSDPFTPPLIDPQYLKHPDDLKALIAAAKHAMAMGCTPAFKKIEAQFVNVSAKLCSYCLDEICRWECIVQNLATSGGYPAGTTRMGKCGQCSRSVVNAKFQVHGVQNLRVADASVMPEITSGNIYAAKIMLAQRAADFILKDNNPKYKMIVPYKLK